MSKFCWPDGQGKAYCISADDMFNKDVGIILADVWEEEYPIQYCAKFLEEQANNESNISCPTSAGKQT